MAEVETTENKSAFADLINVSSGLNNSGGHTFVDGDTLRNEEGQLVRIEGLEAAEIAHLRNDNTFSPGTAGGDQAALSIQNLANKLGYTNVKYLTNADGSPKLDATGTRLMGRMTDNSGRDFTQVATTYGVNQLGLYSTDNEILSSQFGTAERSANLDKPLTDWELAKVQIDAATNAEMSYEQEFKRAALDERTLASWNAPQNPGETFESYQRRLKLAKEYIPGQVQIRKLDRDINNKALSPLSEGIDVGLTGAIEGLYGAAQLVGESTGFKWLENVGTAGITRQHAYLANMPELKLSAFKPIIDKNGVVTGNEWDIKGVGEFFEYLGTNAAVSIPYMANTVGATLLAGPTFGLSMLSPAAVYTGQTWNEMEGDNKNAGLAIAAGVTQAILDRIGLKGLVGGSILKKATRDAAIKKIMASGVGKAVAEQTLAKLTRVEVAKFVGSAAEVAKAQLKSRNVLRALVAQSAKGFASESMTEGAQELTAYMAAVAGSDKVFDAVELESRLLNAFIAGGTMGSTFAIPGVAYDAGAWADVAVRQLPAEAKRLSFAGKWAADEKKRTGSVNSVQQNNSDAKADINKRVMPTASFSEKAEAGTAAKKGRSGFDKVKDAWESTPVLWRGSTRMIFTEKLQNASRAMRKLADGFGGNLQRIYSGSNFENRKKHILTQYRNSVSSPAEFATAAGFKNLNQGELSNIIYTFGRWAGSKKLTPKDWNKLPAELQQHRTWLAKYYAETSQLSDKLYTDQIAAGATNLNRLENYLLRYKSFNKGAIEKDKNGFIAALEKDYNFSNLDATELTNNILNQELLVGETDAFTVGKGKFIPASHKKRTLNLAENKNFNAYMETDAFTNISNASKSAARYITYQEFLGNNNEVINELLNQAMEEGVPAADVNRVAAELQDYLDAESGNYKRLDNETIAKVQKHLGLWTTIAGLPLATISSFVELAITMQALTPKQISTTIMKASKEMAEAMWSTIKNPTLSSTEKQLEKEQRQSNIKRLGFFDWDVGAAQTTGATENTHASRHLLDKYFKIIGLQQWTDYTRSIRASIADDFIMSKVNAISNQRQMNKQVGPFTSATASQIDNEGLYTNAIQEAEEQLRNLGINVDRIIEMNDQVAPWSATQQAEFDAMMLEAQFNFVNQAIALPGTANRPLYYQNQHLALFTQFQGFIATFTANQIPRMWGEYVSRGTPAMKYNAFAVMSTMIMLGFVSQYLKDLIKYGKPSPYLDDVEKFQRAIGSSGLMGTGERVVNLVFPIYESSSDNAAEWFFNTVSGEAAALSNVSRAAGGIGKIVEGKTDKGVYDLLKTAPFTGPFNQFNRYISELFK
tara:strand:+ start:2583 stop:6560 length:3978 start_codon:yes stop_codon:yes gene_type:complete